SSRSIISASHFVFGAAPIIMKSEFAGTWLTLFVVEHRTDIASRRSSPCTSTTDELNSIWTFGVCFSWLIKYCDIEVESDEPRTSITTRRAYLEKYIAACPALF